MIERRDDRYKLEGRPSVGEVCRSTNRLLSIWYQGMRGRAFKLESYIEQFVVAELLPQVYSGESFPGFERHQPRVRHA